MNSYVLIKYNDCHDTYYGQIVNGSFSGYGTFVKIVNSTFAIRYRGEWLNSMKHGFGTYEWCNVTMNGSNVMELKVIDSISSVFINDMIVRETHINEYILNALRETDCINNYVMDDLSVNTKYVNSMLNKDNTKTDTNRFVTGKIHHRGFNMYYNSISGRLLCHSCYNKFSRINYKIIFTSYRCHSNSDDSDIYCTKCLENFSDDTNMISVANRDMDEYMNVVCIKCFHKCNINILLMLENRLLSNC